MHIRKYDFDYGRRMLMQKAVMTQRFLHRSGR